MIKLTIANLKQLIRDKQTLFWTLIFPVIFIVVFGLFRFDMTMDINILVVDKLNSPISKQYINNLKSIDSIYINDTIKNTKEAKEILRNLTKQEFAGSDNKVTNEAPDIIMEIEPIASENQNQQIHVNLIYDESTANTINPASIVSSIINEMTTKQLLEQMNLKKPIVISTETIDVNDLNYLSILLPGILAMGIMQSGIFGIATEITTLKERKILKRLKTTPLSINKFLITSLITRLILAFLQISLILIIGVFLLDIHIYGSIFLLYAINLFSSLIFFNIGFIIASIAKNPRAAQGLSQAITTPMMFLSGVFFTRDTLPKIIKFFADYMPLSPLIDASRAIVIKNAGIIDIRNEILILIIWTILTLILAIKFNILNKEE